MNKESSQPPSYSLLDQNGMGVHEQQPGNSSQPSMPGGQASQPLALLLQALQSSLSTSPQMDLQPYSGELIQDATKTDPSTVNPANGLDRLASAAVAARNCLSGSCTDVSHPLNGLHTVGSMPNLDTLAQLNALSQQNQGSFVAQHQAPPISSILTPADTSLLTSLLALQQRQYWQALGSLNGDQLLAFLRGGSMDHGRSHSQPSSPSSLYKTELCRSWQETGSCRYGNKCQFAHGPDELRPIQRHPKYKTEICRTFATTGTCPYGTRCRFIHYFQRPAISPLPLLGQPGFSAGLQSLQHASSANSLDNYLASSAGHSLLAGAGSFSLDAPSSSSTYFNNNVQGSNGVYMPPLPPPAAEQGLASGLPSLTPPLQAGGGNGLISSQRRLPVFKDFTEPTSSGL